MFTQVFFNTEVRESVAEEDLIRRFGVEVFPGALVEFDTCENPLALGSALCLVSFMRKSRWLAPWKDDPQERGFTSSPPARGHSTNVSKRKSLRGICDFINLTLDPSQPWGVIHYCVALLTEGDRLYQ